MQFKNTKVGYGIISISLHWVMAILIIGLFFLGQYMVELDYYDSLYQIAPWWHKSLGLSVFVLLIIRLFWRLKNDTPLSMVNNTAWTVKIAASVHVLFYVLIVIICFSGYFVSTAKGAGVEVFGLFNFPSVITLNESQADLVSKVHEIATQILIIFVVIHGLAALKHHFINKDNTLVRILKPSQLKENQ